MLDEPLLLTHLVSGYSQRQQETSKEVLKIVTQTNHSITHIQDQLLCEGQYLTTLTHTITLTMGGSTCSPMKQIKILEKSSLGEQ
jgi:hypothetical protein